MAHLKQWHKQFRASVFGAVRLFWVKRQAQAPAPKALWIGLLVCLALTASLSIWRGTPQAQQDALGLPPSTQMARLYSLDDGVAFAKLLNLIVQAHDVQPGLSLRYGQLDYNQLIQWLDLSLALDPTGQYPLMAGSRLYTQKSADPVRQRKMTDWVANRFEADPARRWQWMAHIAYVAKIQFEDDALALRYAEELRQKTETILSVPAWARQLGIFYRVNMKDSDRAKYLIKQLLNSGLIKDDHEWKFLKKTLDDIEQGIR